MLAARDLFLYSSSFRSGVIILVFVLLMVGLSFVSPYEPDDRREVPRNRPPSSEYIMGTTATGQDVFWMLTFAIRNTLIVAGIAVLIGRSIGVMLGMISGYLGGTVDRVLSSIVDSFIVIPRLPLLPSPRSRTSGRDLVPLARSVSAMRSRSPRTQEGEGGG